MTLAQLKLFFRQKIKVVAGGPEGKTRGQGLLDSLDKLAEAVAEPGQLTPPTAAQIFPLLQAGTGIEITRSNTGKILISCTVEAANAPDKPSAPTNGQVDDTADTFSFLANPVFPSFAQYKVAGLPGVTGAVALDATNSYVSGGRIYVKVVGAVAKGGLAVYVAGSGSVPDGAVLTNDERFTGVAPTTPSSGDITVINTQGSESITIISTVGN
jgi:hypothetical protein